MNSEAGPVVSAVKLALMARQARAQFVPLLRAEPIAIIGMGCRFPGGANSPDKFWALLRDGVDAVREIPPERWDVDATFDPDPAAAGKSSARHAGMLDEVDHFDASFFGILPREAERMDPQQRLFMEVAIEALDDAGLVREQLSGSRTGVFVASYHNDYAMMQYADPLEIDSRTLTGTLHSVIPNRLSHFLDLRGPSISLDTACSSSLVAIHQACQSLRSGECEAALAGGVSVIASPDLMISLTKVGFTSQKGRCRTFDEQADGFVRGEGCGVVVLKRLGDAIAAGDHVLAVIRSSVVNQDGRSTVMAAPNGLAQEALVREALDAAQMPPGRVGFVETHGTATALGDPIEVEALANVLGSPRDGGGVCFLGSAKASIGHLEAAAGVAGVIKATLALQHGQIPPQVHFVRPNPHLALDGTCLRIPAELQDWPRGNQPRVAGVSSFGVGGTNAHVLLEEAPVLPAQAAAPVPGGMQVLPLSAHDDSALRDLASAWADFLPKADAPLASICASAAVRRSHHERRVAITGTTPTEMAGQLRTFVSGGVSPHIASVGCLPRSRRLAFVFAGQGPQWHAMGRQLMLTEPVFRESMATIDALLIPQSGWSLLEMLGADAESSRLDETLYAQPALFAIQVSLAALWNSWGIEPDGVVGHSIGELAALHVSGAMTLPEAVRLVWQRATAMQRASGNGAMASVFSDESTVAAVIARYGNSLGIGAVNAPRSVVISGASEAVSEALEVLGREGVTYRRLPVRYAFHSHEMEQLSGEFVAAAGLVQARSPTIPFYSTVSGRSEAGTIDAGYLGRNIRQPVRFSAAIGAMLDDGFGVFLEIGPHPVLAASIAERAAESDVEPLLLASLRREHDERASMLRACSGLYAALRSPRWTVINTARPAAITLPSYPWQHRRYWLRSRPEGPVSSEPAAAACLGRRIPSAVASLFESRWPHHAPSWLADHRIHGRLLMPAAAMLEGMRQAAADALGHADVEVSDFIVHRPLALPDDEGASVVWQISARIDGETARLELHKAPAADTAERNWQLIASACAARAVQDVDANDAIMEDHEIFDPRTQETFYAGFGRLGADFGRSFRTVRSLRCEDGGAIAVLHCAVADAAGDGKGLHPTMIDGAMQACVAAATAGGGNLPRELMLPLGIDAFRVVGTAPDVLHARIVWRRGGEAGSATADIRLSTPDGCPVAELRGARFVAANAGTTDASHVRQDWLHDVAWESTGTPRPVASDPPASAWVLISDASGIAGDIKTALHASGCECALLPPERLSELDSLLTDMTWRQGQPLGGVVHLCSVDIAPGERSDAGAGECDAEVDRLTSISALHVYQSMVRGAPPGSQLVLVTRGAQPAGNSVVRPAAAGLWGLQSTVVAENPDFPCRVIDMDDDAAAFDCQALLSELRASSGPGRLAIRGASRLQPVIRQMPALPTAVRSVRLQVHPSGVLDALDWQSLELPHPGRGEVRVRIAATGLNFRDVMLALRMYPAGEDLPLGAECAGVVEAVGAGVQSLAEGDAVFGYVPASLATVANVPADFLAPVPQELSMEQAAALPVAFLTAMYGLQRVAGLQRGMSILVHAGTGGVGMAAVQLALRAGATVYATAGSDPKRHLLRSLGVHHVLDSRSLDFVKEIHELTSGRGVDVVLNSLAGEFIAGSVEVLAARGCFLELGKRSVWTHEQFSGRRPDARYVVYDLGSEAHSDRALLGPMINELVEAIRCGELRPLPVRVFDLQDARDAFRIMAKARHTGKLVIRAATATVDSRKGTPLCRTDATYLITGGLGAIGRATAKWLVDNGARSLVLVGRRAPDADFSQTADYCRDRGAHVQVHSIDVADQAIMRRLFNDISASMPPLRGIVHAAGIVDDGALLNQDAARWTAVLRGKAHGARVLHALTASMSLDFFILYSAAGLLLGPAGQGPYAAANAELDALAHSRRAAGLPATSAAWGMWREGGMAVRSAGDWTGRGLGWIPSPQGFACLEDLLRRNTTYGAILPINWKRFLAGRVAGREFFRLVAKDSGNPQTHSMAPASRQHLVDALRAAPAAQRIPLLAEHLVTQARAVLGLDPSIAIQPDAPLKEAGLDSLMAVELRNVLTRSVGRSLPATLLFDYPSVESLASYLLRTLDLAASAQGAPQHEEPAVSTSVAALSEEEAEAQLLAELEGASKWGER